MSIIHSTTAKPLYGVSSKAKVYPFNRATAAVNDTVQFSGGKKTEQTDDEKKAKRQKRRRLIGGIGLMAAGVGTIITSLLLKASIIGIPLAIAMDAAGLGLIIGGAILAFKKTKTPTEEKIDATKVDNQTFEAFMTEDSDKNASESKQTTGTKEAKEKASKKGTKGKKDSEGSKAKSENNNPVGEEKPKPGNELKDKQKLTAKKVDETQKPETIEKTPEEQFMEDDCTFLLRTKIGSKNLKEATGMFNFRFNEKSQARRDRRKDMFGVNGDPYKKRLEEKLTELIRKSFDKLHKHDQTHTSDVAGGAVKVPYLFKYIHDDKMVICITTPSKYRDSRGSRIVCPQMFVLSKNTTLSPVQQRLIDNFKDSAVIHGLIEGTQQAGYKALEENSNHPDIPELDMSRKDFMQYLWVGSTLQPNQFKERILLDFTE